jgi:hypothetical protein
MIVSHLDELKNIGTTVRIMRDASTCRIAFGDAHSDYRFICKIGRKCGIKII